MKLLLLIVIAGITVYLLVKLCLYLYRPFFLSKTFREIDQVYSNLLAATDHDIASAVEDYRKWQSGDKVVTTLRTEDELTTSVNTAKRAKAHVQEVHEKFLKLRERFIGDPKKLSESIEAYRRYLVVRSRQRQDATLFSNAVTSGAVTVNEMMAAAKETMIILEESERKLDVLLT